ncbi:hypothetical protein Bca4012_063446 [Brassica carinata]
MTVKAVKDVVSAEVWEYVKNSPLGVNIKYVNLEFAWISKLLHYILSRQLFCKKQHELWFLIEKQPARFSLFEFEDITGLNCDPIPNRMVVEDVEKSNRFWGLFKLKHPRSTPSSEDVLALCQSPEVYESWSREDQIRLCYLAILTGGLLGLDRREAIPPAKAKLLVDLEIFEQYPWGRVAFVELVNQIKTKTEIGDIKQGCYVCKAFVQVIQIWAYAYIPCLGEAIGRPIRSNGLCLLRFKGGNGKLPLGNILQNANVTCMCPRIMDEFHPVWEHQDDDPEIDNLLEFLRQEKSLSTITWQAFPEYPLTPIKCNKRRRVASQRKSKKSKKLASREQENVGDGGENSGDISEKKDKVESDDDEGKYFIQRRQSVRNLVQELTERVEAVEMLINSGLVSAIFQSPTGITMDNLASRVTQLEEIYQVKILEHDWFSNTKLPAKPAIPEKLEGSIGETTTQGIGGPQVPEKEEEKKEDKPVGEDDNAGAGIGEDLEDVGDGIDVEECAPQTTRGHPDNPEVENAGEDIKAEPSKKQDQRLLTPKDEAASESNKEPDYERAIALSSESNDLTYPHAFTPKEKTDHFETTSSADLAFQRLGASSVREKDEKQMLPQANNPPPRFQDSRIPVLAQNLRSPFLLDDTQVKGVVNIYVKPFTLNQLEEVLYAPAAASDITALTTFRNNCDSIYPIGSEKSASEFFDVFLKPRAWLEDLQGMFPSSKIAILDVPFQMMWVYNYKEWQRSSILPGGTYSYYHRVFPRYARTYKWWKGDVDTIFSCLNVNNNTHWVAMVISIPDQTIKLYDSGKRTPGDIALKKQAEPFAFMVPYAIYMYTSEEEQPSVDLNPFKIECVRDGVPRARYPYGDCGVYALNFLECLMLGVDLKAIHLNDAKMAEVREKLAVEMYLETTKKVRICGIPHFGCSPCSPLAISLRMILLACRPASDTRILKNLLKAKIILKTSATKDLPVILGF